MRWMEMVRLRTGQGKEKEITRMLLDTVKQINGEEGLIDAHVFSCAAFHSDLALSLAWETDTPERHGSRVALSIAQMLKDFGLVEHTVWNEARIKDKS